MAFKEGVSVGQARQAMGLLGLEERNAYMRAAIRVAVAGLGKVVEKERMLRMDAEDALRSERGKVTASEASCHEVTVRRST